MTPRTPASSLSQVAASDRPSFAGRRLGQTMRDQHSQVLQRMLLRRLMDGSGAGAGNADPEKRAPGWQVRCTRCGFTEPWGKYGVRLGAASWKKYTIGRCAQCRRLGFHAIERRPTAAT